MLTEPSRVARLEGGLRRRWFTNEDLDLFLWFDHDGKLSSLQLCYGKATQEHVLSWRRAEGYRHDRVDDGEGVAGRARSPVLVMDGQCDVDGLLEQFLRASMSLDDDLVARVSRRLVGYRYRR